MTIRKRAISGVKWSTVSQFGRQETQLVTTIILARLLSPSDFGLVGMAMVVIGFIGIFKDLGTSAAIIQKKEPSAALLSSIFWVNVGFGALAMAVLFFGAPLWGLFYHEPRVNTILRVLSLTFFISGLSILQQALLEKSLEFKKLAKVEISSVGSGAIIGIGMAFSGFGVWSLIFQSLTTVSVTTILLWLSSTWRPKWIFHWKEVKSVSSYSIHLIGANMFDYFATNADYLLIGRYLGAQDLGYYTLAYRILLFPLKNISRVIGRVMFPVYSSIQEDNAHFAKIYLKVANFIALISVPIMMGLLVLAQPFVLTVFGTKWHPVILLIMIFAPLGIMQSIGTTVGAIYNAKGRTDWAFRWSLVANSYVTLSFFIGLQWGIIGVAVAYTVASFSLFYFSFAIPFKLIDLKFSRLLNVLWWPFANSMVMFVVLIAFRAVLPSSLPNVWVLVLSVGLGIVVYAVASWITNREQLRELWGLTGFKKLKPVANL